MALAAFLALSAAAATSARAATQTLKAGVYGDEDAKLVIVLQQNRSGKPQRVKRIQAKNYDLSCNSVLQPEVVKTFEVDFSFPSMKVVQQKGDYRYAFSGEAGDGDSFSDGYYQHGGEAAGYFAANRAGRPTKLVGYLGMFAYSNVLSGVKPPGICGDPARSSPFEKVHGSFSMRIR